MIMYIVTGIVFLLIAINYYLGYSLYKLPSNEGYFNNVKTLMNIGDIIIINASDNTTIKKINITELNVTTVALA